MAAKAPAHLRPTAGGRLSWRPLSCRLLGHKADMPAAAPMSAFGSNSDSSESPGSGRLRVFPCTSRSKFPRVPPRISASARIDRKGCPHRKAPCPSRRFLAARRVCQRSVRSRCNARQRRLVLDISNTRLSEKTTTHIHRRFASRVTCTVSRGALRQAILLAPRRDNALCCGTGGWVEPTRFARRSAHTRELLCSRCYDN